MADYVKASPLLHFSAKVFKNFLLNIPAIIAFKLRPRLRLGVLEELEQDDGIKGVFTAEMCRVALDVSGSE